MSGSTGKRKGWTKRVLLEGVDFGDGKPTKAWLIVTDTGVTVRRWHSWKRYHVDLADAAGVLVRRAQVRICQSLMR